MQDERERLRLMLDAAPLGISYFDESLKAVDCNQELLKMFGLTERDEYFELLYKMMPPYQANGQPSKEAFLGILKEAFLQSPVQREFTFRKLDGTILPTETAFVCTKDNKGFVVICYTRDLTIRYKALEREQEAVATTRIMLDAMPIACYLVRQDFSVIDCNKAAVELFGFSNREEAIERYLDTFVTDPRPRGNFNSVIERGHISFEYTRVHSSGLHIACNITLVRLNYHGEMVFGSYIRDLRDVKEVYEMASRYESVADESRAKSQFLARMSHEIRTPVSVISGIANIQLHRGSNSLETEEAFMQIYNSTELLTSIINDILDLSKVASGKMEIVEKAYDTASLILDTVQFNLLHRGSRRITFLLDIDEQIPACFIGDELRIKQILNNLLSNAFKYTKEGHIALSFGVENNSGEFYFTISVSDTGRGMSQEQLESLFNTEYARFNEFENRQIVGTGLGMSITNELIRLMKGEIAVDSELDRGSWFHIRIPQKPKGKEILGNETVNDLKNYDHQHRKKEDYVYEPMPYGRVLVVDDQESNLYVAKGLLMPYKISVDTAESGMAALEKVKAGEIYDIIFMDHMMPEMDGIEAAKLIKEQGYDLPIVALTANAILGQAELFMNNGFAGFISKPIDLIHLNMYLMRLIRDKYPAEILEAAQRVLDRQEGSQDYISNLSPGIIESFIRDAERSLQYLEAFIDKIWVKDELKNFTITMHGMKSSIINVGDTALSELAGALENAGRNAEVKFIRENTTSFIEKLRAFITVLTRQEALAEVLLDEDPPFLLEQLQVFQRACENFNKRGARNALNAINKKSWSKESAALLSKLSAHLLHSNFEAAASLALEAQAFIRGKD